MSTSCPLQGHGARCAAATMSRCGLSHTSQRDSVTVGCVGAAAAAGAADGTASPAGGDVCGVCAACGGSETRGDGSTRSRTSPCSSTSRWCPPWSRACSSRSATSRCSSVCVCRCTRARCHALASRPGRSSSTARTKPSATPPATTPPLSTKSVVPRRAPRSLRRDQNQPAEFMPVASGGPHVSRSLLAPIPNPASQRRS